MATPAERFGPVPLGVAELDTLTSTTACELGGQVAESHCAVITTTDSAQAAEELGRRSLRDVLGRASRSSDQFAASIGGRAASRVTRSGSVG